MLRGLDCLGFWLRMFRVFYLAHIPEWTYIGFVELCILIFSTTSFDLAQLLLFVLNRRQVRCILCLLFLDKRYDGCLSRHLFNGFQTVNLGYLIPCQLDQGRNSIS